jgi:sialate O-acetylesterase
MMMMMKTLCYYVLLSLLAFLVHSSNAKLQLPTFIASHMVLQREPQQARVWGWAAASAKVTLTVYDSDKNTLEVVSTIADPQSGAWEIDIPPQPPRTGVMLQFLAVVFGETNIRILKDVAFGDVFLCSGQSNMEMSIAGVFNASDEIQDSMHYPHLRLASVNHSVAHSVQSDAGSKTTDYVWARSSPKAMDAAQPFSWFSASCYFFGRDLYQHHYNGSVPIGLVSSSYGGTRVECWSSPTAMQDETCGGITTTVHAGADVSSGNMNSGATTAVSTTTTTTTTTTLANNEKKVASSSSSLPYFLRASSSRRDKPNNNLAPVLPEEDERRLSQDHHNLETVPPLFLGGGDGDNHCNLEDGAQDSQLWNGMIHPFLHMRFVGALWYQGEANALGAANYACRFPAMISDWRKQFLEHDTPFVYVQLAAFDDSADYSKIRAAQDAALALPKVGVAHAIDLGDPSSPCGAIHSRRKQEVGRRLSLAMRAMMLQSNETEGSSNNNNNNNNNTKYWSGPVLLSPVQIVNHTVAILTFDSQTTDGMHLHGTGGCTECCDGIASPFETMDSNGNWSLASVVHIQEDTVTIQASNNEILGVHLHWENFPQCALYNGQGGPDDHSGLPAPPAEWCAYPTPGEGPWTGRACGTTPADHTE